MAAIANLATPHPAGVIDKPSRDEELMAAVMLGNIAALRPIVERYQTTLLRLFHRVLGADDATAEDLVQETFIRLLQQRSFRPDRPFRPWLYTVASNLARDHRRAQARRPQSAGEEELLEIPDGGPGPHERAERTAELRRVAVALAQLPAPYRQTLTLRYVEEMRVNEIARFLRLPVGTVKSRLTMGRKRLRALLEGPADYEMEAI